MATNRNTRNLTTLKAGQKFGRLTAVEFLRRNKDHRPIWKWLCDCGKEHEADAKSVRSGNTKSCGCWKKEEFRARVTTHGMTGSPEHMIWGAMIQRCTNPDAKDFDHYGGRGITVCDRWRDFANFYADMAPRPKGGTLERIENDDPYSKENCRWASRKEQARNTRRNITVIYQGREMCISEACELSGVGVSTAFNRRNKGWPDDRLFIDTLKGWSRRKKHNYQE